MQDEYMVDGGDRSLRTMMDDSYRYAYTVNASFWAEGTIDKRFKAGDQSLWATVYGEEPFYRRRRFFFNLIRRHINMIAGHQRKNRKSLAALPVEMGDEKLADQFTKMFMWQTRVSGAHEYLSQAFEGGALDTGMALIHTYPDYSKDPVNGDIACDYVAYNNFLIDPYWRKQDLSDCNFVWRRRWVSTEAACALLPSREKEIRKMRPQGAKDGKFPVQAELITYDKSYLHTYDEYHYLDQREALLVIDLQTGETSEWQGDESELQEILQSQPWLTSKKISKSTVKLVIALNDKIMYHGPNLLNIDRYPFVPVVGYYDPDLRAYAWRCQGVVRNLRDAQYLYNRRKVIELDILESQCNSGWVVPAGVVADHRELFKTGQGQVINLKQGKTPADLERIQPPQVPPSMIELSRALAQDISEISGVNEELLGSAEDDKAGILAMLRQGAGLTTLQTLFDRLDYSYKLLGRIWLEAFPKMFTVGKVKRILGEEPHPRFFESDLSKYDIAVEEAMLSSTQKQLQLKQLLYFREAGIAIPDRAIINAATIENKTELLKVIDEQEQQQQQMQQQQIEAQAQQTQMDMAAKQSKAQADQAKAQELLASADEKKARLAEIEASAENKSAEADLKLVRELSELEDLEFGRMQKLLDMAQQIRQERAQAESGQIIYNNLNPGDQNG